jgi:hypothetical protein
MDGEIAQPNAILIDQGSALENEINLAFHRASLIVAQSDRKWC